MMESPLFWPVKMKGHALLVLEETRIPEKIIYIRVTSTTQAVQVIREMKTRAFGQFLVVGYTFLLEINRNKKVSDKKLVALLAKTAKALNHSRPTFPFSEVTGLFLHWAKQTLRDGQNVRKVMTKKIQGYLEAVRLSRLARVNDIVKNMKDGDSILTHCNVSGELAMAAGIARREGKSIQFFATETRPYFQGAKLTCWELRRAGVDVTLICDNAVGAVMADHLVNKVIVGSDRNCANGDFANKIGTYQIAVLAKEFRIPFYVLTQPSQKTRKGSDIPIELRAADEVLMFAGKRLYPPQVKGFYPGFDVVPNNLITKVIPLHVN
jgi:methylthioribose-1-phosphate isomerase